VKKNKYLESENIFLDASIFEEQNFLHSTKIHSLFHYVNTGLLKMHLTTLSRLELNDRIVKRVRQSKAEFKKIEKAFNNKNIRILKNTTIYEDISIPKIDIDKNSSEIKQKIDNLFKRLNVHTIPNSNIPITEIAKNYYNRRPPFHNSGKQNEFIDAIILKSLENWCIKNDTKMYVLSKDPDFLGYKSKYLIIKKDLTLFLKDVSKYYNQTYKLRRIRKVQRIIKREEEGLTYLASNIIANKLNIKSATHEISHYKITEVLLNNYDIISFREDRTEIECNFKVKLELVLFEPLILDFDAKRLSFTIKIPLYAEINERGKLDLKNILENVDYEYKE